MCWLSFFCVVFVLSFITCVFCLVSFFFCCFFFVCVRLYVVFTAGSRKDQNGARRLGGRTATCVEAGATRSWLRGMK